MRLAFNEIGTVLDQIVNDLHNGFETIVKPESGRDHRPTGEGIMSMPNLLAETSRTLPGPAPSSPQVGWERIQNAAFPLSAVLASPLPLCATSLEAFDMRPMTGVDLLIATVAVFRWWMVYAFDPQRDKIWTASTTLSDRVCRLARQPVTTRRLSLDDLEWVLGAVRWTMSLLPRTARGQGSPTFYQQVPVSASMERHNDDEARYIRLDRNLLTLVLRVHRKCHPPTR